MEIWKDEPEHNFEHRFVITTCSKLFWVAFGTFYIHVQNNFLG